MKKKSIMFKLSLLGISSIAIPIVLTSCSDASVYSVKAKEYNSADYQSNKLYSSLTESNLSIKDAIYGSNYNEGNYIFIYGTLTSSDVLSFLYQNSNNIIPYNEKAFDGSFFKRFYQQGGLGNGVITGLNVKIIMYIDIPPNNDDAIEPLQGKESPFSTYSADDVLIEANRNAPNRYEQSTLPDEFKFKIGTYKRYDQKAIDYRDLVSYIQTIRPNMQGTANDGGLIAFKKDSDPKSYSVSFSSYDSILSYYQGKK